MRRVLPILAASLPAAMALAACSSRDSSGNAHHPRGAAMAGDSAAAAQGAAAKSADTGWESYGGDPGGTRYSPLSQISPANVGRLQVAWVYRTGELGQGVTDWQRSAFEATPILYQGKLYFTTPSTNVVAVDAATGALRWRHDSHNANGLHYSDGVSRGVSLWVDPFRPASAECRARIFAPTLDGRLLALDAETGTPCRDFGDHGAIDLRRGVRYAENPSSGWRNYLVTSPPAIVDGKVIVGASIGDNRAVAVELGTVRAFDAESGRLLWSWDPIPRDPSNPVYKEWSAQGAKVTGAANAWAPLSVDAARHLVFVPTGSASPDFFGGGRPGDDRWADSVVALDADTGKLLWGRQLVHHNLWDYDVASQPTLVDLTHDGRQVPAVIQATKTGFLYTLNRETGAAIFPIVEKPVPQDAAPGETPSPTQPYPAAPPALVPQGPVTPADAWGVAWLDKRACRQRIEADRSEGMFQPPSTRESIYSPGFAGGSNWGGIAFDPRRQLVIANTMNLPWLMALVPRQKVESEMRDPKYRGWEFGQMQGTPYAMRRRTFESDLGIPCVRPPWGTLTAVDMVHGTIKWQVPLGDAPIVHLNLGMPSLGGPVVTASGLVFIAATFDDRMRAFDIDSGKVLWQAKLPAGGQATPMTYSVGGRQYVVIAAGGYKDTSTRGDYLIAFALPR
ncbi:MAG TPA: pyrroloquinoline quinone-dependent dehydrogenase [Steroidobacteraceae bacterium]|nr:pyrroloquinoline quinone-dependent dehydrogenase [Steroidobacteraceae bacterium]